MRLPDGTTLMHTTDTPYDPAKAHAYYIRTRQLKGLRKAAEKPTIAKTKQHKTVKSSTFTVQTPSGKSFVLSEHELNIQKQYAAHRVQRILGKLHLLEAELRKRSSDIHKKASDAKKPETAAEKHKRAQEEKKSAAKHQTENKNKAKSAAAAKKSKTQANTDTVAGLKHTIETVKTKLLKAVDHQRALMAATKN